MQLSRRVEVDALCAICQPAHLPAFHVCFISAPCQLNPSPTTHLQHPRVQAEWIPRPQRRCRRLPICLRSSRHADAHGRGCSSSGGSRGGCSTCLCLQHRPLPARGRWQRVAGTQKVDRTRRQRCCRAAEARSAVRAARRVRPAAPPARRALPERSRCQEDPQRRAAHPL